jgi:hypothetical protein
MAQKKTDNSTDIEYLTLRIDQLQYRITRMRRHLEYLHQLRSGAEAAQHLRTGETTSRHPENLDDEKFYCAD